MRMFKLNDDYSTTEVFSPIEFGQIFYDDRRFIRQEKVNGYRISTVFLGLDHSYNSGSDEPLIFETMIFKGDSFEDVEANRYPTYEKAICGHIEMVKIARELPRYEDDNIIAE